MIAPDLDSAIACLADIVHAAASIVPFTGAGISTECGIPDFSLARWAVDQEPADTVRRIYLKPGSA
jgi:hypothetical protein